ncbi:TonB family protein [Nostoc flagelliforme FACHB-838]|uniref:TonB family protein n=1 Tax=Nostoc flagelliforme FACHB-838 TaxID=2692904 RepID=A0ABR8DZP2_9NOSO|nr:energy transducer TonB [Nostoc flagelliforme]MBD2534668.1 TonB family protein [Nostoc flagelliforme FACHB-838]
MTSFDEFVYHRRVRPLNMLQGVVTSILLHSILLMGSKYWHTALMREPKQEITQEIPIEVVEVTPDKTDIPPQTSLRATKNSIAGGKALPERPVSVVKSASPTGHKAYKERSFETTSSPAQVLQTGRQQQKTESPNRSGQQPQFKPQKTALAPATTAQVSNSKKIAVAPMTTPPAQLEKTAPLATLTSPNPKQITSAPATEAQMPNSKKIAVAPIATPLPAALLKTPLERATTLPVPSNPQKLGQLRVGLSGQTPTQTQSSLKTGAASLLGGTVGVSSQNYRGDQLASVPNSNRDRQATSGIDARSQDIDLTSYLNKLKQRVQQQWLPGMSQSNRRTVVNFTINRSGQVSNLNIAQTSGFSVTDEVAHNAIQKAAPFAPLPTGYPKNHIDIEFTFDINVYGELNLWRDGG